jgi:type IV secretion system protein VirB4
VLRSKRAFIVFATQSLGEIARLENLEGIVTNIPTQILLPAVKNSVHQQADLFREVFGTNDSQLELLAKAIPKRDYLIIKPSVTRLVTTQMPPLLIAINEATAVPSLRSAVLAAAQAGGADWELNFVRNVLHVQI